MSKSIDQRIVEMEFDNRQFESGVKESLGSLDKLNKALDMEGAGKGLEGLDQSMRNFSFAGIAEGVDTIAQKFTTLGIIGITAIQNITNRVIDLGIQLGRSISIDQITAGWTKYEQKTASVQTIMNATGKSIDDVNGYLDKLMWFSDETSYGFTDMTAALAQMTSSGGNIDNLIPLITGVANATAYAGKGAAEFARAMYNLNQSYGSGNLQYMDWRSLELAGVAGQELKQVFIDTAIGLGYLNKEGKTAKGTLVTIGNFGTTLQEKWANTEVMEKAFGKFSELSEEAYKLVESGQYDTAAAAMEALAGKYSEVAEKAFKSAQQAKSFTEAIDATKDAVSSGWMKTFEIIFGNLEEATVFWTDFTGLLWDTFASGAEARNELLKGWKDLGGRDILLDSFWNLVDAIEKVTTPIKEAFSDIFPPVTAERLFALTEGLKAFTERLKMGEETSDKIKRTFAGFFAVLSIGAQAISAVIKGVNELIKILIPGASGFLGLTANIGDGLVALDKIIKETGIFGITIEKVGKIAGFFIEGIVIAVTSLFEILKSFATVDLSGVDSFTERVRIRFEPLAGLFEFIEKTFSKTVQILKKVAPLFFKLASIIGDALIRLQENIIKALDKGDFNSILDLINAGLLGGLLFSLQSFINSFSDISWGIFEVIDSFQFSLKAKALLQIAIAIGILAAALFVLSMIDSEKLASSIAAITALFVNLFGGMSIFTSFLAGKGYKGLFTVTAGMIGISVAVLILSAAMSKLSKLDWEGIEKGLLAVGVMMAMLVMTAKALSTNTGIFIKGATGFILFAVALNILASAVVKLGEIDIVSLTKGLIGVGVLMAELSIFMKVSDLSGMGIFKSIGILILASALVVLSTAVEKFSSIDLGALVKGLFAVGVILAELALFINFTVDANKVITTAIGILILSAALVVLSHAISNLGEMSWEEMIRGLLAMGAALAMITVMLNFMPKNSFINSFALLDIAAALTILAGALKMMGDMSWGSIVKSLTALGVSLGIIMAAFKLVGTRIIDATTFTIMAVAILILAQALKALGQMSVAQIGASLLALAGVFTVIGVASIVLGPLIPIILGLALAITLLGVGVLAAGVGIGAFAAGLTALAVAGTAAGVALVAIVTSIIGLIPLILTKLAQGLVDFAKVLGDGVPIIAKAATDIILAIVLGIAETTPIVVESLLVMMVKLLETLLQHVPVILDTGMKLIIAFLKGISDHIEEVVDTAVDVMLNFLSGIRAKLPDIIDMAFKVIITFINGLANAIRNNKEAIFNACANLIGAIVEAITSLLPLMVQIGKDIISGLIQGVVSMASNLAQAARDVVSDAVGGVKEFLGINSPSKLFMGIGKDSIMGFVNGLKNFGDLVSKEATKVGRGAVDSLTNAVSTITDIISGEVELSPTIRPVIDLTDVRKGWEQIDSAFAQRKGINVSSINSKIPVIGQTSGNGTDETTAQQTSQAQKANVQFVQNNYSPKALSRLEIYRQTRNQISAMKGLVEGI